eukprot:20954_1
MATLKLYDTCNINKPYDQNKLIKFCNDIYSTILDDYIHIITIHSNDSKLQQISESIRCDACNCAMVSRHKRDRTQDSIHQNQSADQHFLFYRDMLDSAHFFLYHLYDFGARIKVKQNKHEAKQENMQQSNFKQLSEITTNYNKFSIGVMHIGSGCIAGDKNMTYIDGLFEFMKEKYVTNKDLETITKSVLKEEEYDSDAVIADMDDDIKYSNIANIVDARKSQLINQYVQQIKLIEQSFHIGYIFYYWDFYKTKRRKEEYLVTPVNPNDHSGYLPHELYVKLKYKSIKHEILQNTICILNINQYNTSLIKAKQFICTEKAKCTRNTRDD